MVPSLGDWSVLHVIEDDHVRWVACHRDAALDEKLCMMAKEPVPLSSRPSCPRHCSADGARTSTTTTRAVVAPAEPGFGGVRARARHALGDLRAAHDRGVTLGALSCMSSEANRYGDDELRLLEDVAHRAALAVDNARTFRQARQAAEMRRDLVAVVAHDLKNPLNAVAMAAALLSKSAAPGTDGDRARRQSGIITRAADRMNRLIHDLLDVSAIDAGRLELEPQPHPVGPLVSEALESMAPMAQERQMTLERVGRAARSRRDRRCAIAIGLCRSSRTSSATPSSTRAPGGRMTLSAQCVDGALSFAVADTGPGSPTSTWRTCSIASGAFAAASAMAPASGCGSSKGWSRPTAARCRSTPPRCRRDVFIHGPARPVKIAHIAVADGRAYDGSGTP